MLLLIVGVAAVLLSWIGISLFKTEPPAATATIEETAKPETQSLAPAPARSAAAPVASDERLPKLAEQPDAPPSPINEVIPDVPRSALDTIRGTIRVSVRVIIDKQGSVLAATAEDGGPSRYFERLSVAASKQWTFTPATSEKERTLLLRFNFTRDGATAHVD